jgi:3-hydroxyacyl-CoA dehydrogenase
MSQDVWTLIGAGMGGKGLAAELGIHGLRLRIHDIDDAQVAGIRAAGACSGRKQNDRYWVRPA